MEDITMGIIANDRGTLKLYFTTKYRKQCPLNDCHCLLNFRIETSVLTVRGLPQRRLSTVGPVSLNLETIAFMNFLSGLLPSLKKFL